MKHTKPMALPDNWQELKPHPLSELTNFGVGIELDDLAGDMRDRGYDEDEPIVLIWSEERKCWEVLDGRHRLPAAVKAGVVPNFVQFTGTEEDAAKYAAKKFNRQHLTVSQRSLGIAAMANRQRGGDRHSESFKAQNCALKPKTFAVSARSVDYGAVVEEHGTGSLNRAVRNGILKVSDAAKIARKPHAVQDYAVKEVQAHRAKTAVEAATLCDRCQKKLTKKGEQPTVDCVVCRDLRENPKPKGAGKGSRKPAKATAQPEPAPEFKPAAVLAAAAAALYEFIDKTPGALGWHDHPEQKKLKADVDELVAALEAWQGRLAGEEAKLFDNKRGQYG